MGGGTAGCVVASRLSLLPWKPKVLLLERGANHHRGFQSNTPLLSVAWQSDESKFGTVAPLSALPSVHNWDVLAFQLEAHAIYPSGKAYCIESTPQAGLNGRTCDLVGGKLLGGTGRINSSLYTRGPPAQFNQ